MAIGDVKVNVGRSIQQQENIIPGQFGSGIARALGNLGNAVGDVASATAGFHDRQNKTEEFETQKRFIEYESEQARVLAESHRAAPPGAAGITNITEEGVTLNNTAFLETIPKRLQEQYVPLLEQLKQGQVNNSFAFEYEQGNKQFRQDISVLSNEQATEVRKGTVDLVTARDNVLSTLALSDLPELEQQTLALGVEKQLALASYAREVERGQATDLPVQKITLGEPSPDVVLSGTSPGTRGLANTVARLESGSRYDVRNDGSAGGAPITDFADHPRITVTLPDGTRTSAAGKYQFTQSTWDVAATALGLMDFSPASQDKAFVYTAEQRLNKLNLPGSPSLEEVLLSNDTAVLAQVHNALKPEWVALENITTEEFVASLQGVDPEEEDATGVPGIRNGAVGTPGRPDVWNDPAYASLSYDEKAKLHADGVTAAKKAQTALDKARKEQQTAAYNTAVMHASTGEMGLADEEALKEAGVLTKYTEVKAFRDAVEDYKTRVASTADLQAQVSNPEHVFTGSKNEDKAFNNLLGQEGKDALGAMDQGFVNTSLLPLIQRTGYIPSESAIVLETMVATGDPKQRTFALETLSNLHGQNPQILERTSGLSDDMKKEVGLYTAMKPFLSETELAERVKLSRDPAYVTQRNELLTAGRKDFQDNVDNAKLLDALDPRLIGFDPVMPLTAQQQFLLRKEAKMLYAEGWAISQSESASLEYAAKQLQRQWSMSDIGGVNRMMRNAPQTYYPSVNGGHSYIDYLTRRDAGLEVDEEFTLVADGQTRQEAAAFQKAGEGYNASYMIGVKDAEGNYGVKMDESGKLPLRIAFDPEDPELVEGRNWVVSYENLAGRIAEAQQVLDNVPESEQDKAFTMGGVPLKEELAQLRTSATTLREERPPGLEDDNTSLRLLSTMEAEAQEMFNRAGGDFDTGMFAGTDVANYYTQLLADIEQRGGKIPGEVEDK
jgi:muramidase (phage lysozyme)